MSKIRKSRRNVRSALRKNLRIESLENRSVLSGASPMAVNDLFQTLVDQPYTSSVGAVLANDTDAEGDTLTASLFNGPANGTLEFNADGSFVYTPNAGFSGVDSFLYQANDGTSSSSLAAVTLRVSPEQTPPLPTNDAYSLEEDGLLNITESAGLLANDNYSASQNASVSLVDGPTNGTLELAEDGSFVYTPNANFSGDDSFTYAAIVNGTTIGQATVSISVTSVNDAPQSGNDVYEVNEDTLLTAEGNGVLANDTDADGDTLSAVIVSQPVNGTVELSADGSFVYTPNENFFGVDGFSYMVGDGQTMSDVATVTINVNPVNDAPVGADFSYSVEEDTTLEILAPGILEGATDVDSETLTAIVRTGPTNGTLTLSEDGSFIYTPNENFFGLDTFTFVVSDGVTESAEQTVSIDVTAVNDAPVGADFSFSVEEDMSLEIAAPGLLEGATDIDGDTLTAAIAMGPTNGTVTINADGSFLYTPSANFFGSDSFTFVVSDGVTTSAEQTVSIEVTAVNDAPVGADFSYTIDEDTVLEVAAPGVLEGATDVEGDPLTVEIVNGPTNGTVTLASDGSFIYTPSANYFGSDSFTFVVSDGVTTSAEQTVSIEVAPIDDTPVTMSDMYSVGEDGTLSLDAGMGVLANDLDPQGLTLSAEVVTGPTNGTLTLGSDGSLVYTPAANWNGVDSFTYIASNGSTPGVETSVTITVQSLNDMPVAQGDAYEVTSGEELLVDAAGGIMANDSDVDGDALTAHVIAPPQHGTLELAADGSLRYIPAAGYVGEDHFTYQLRDSMSQSNVATVVINVGEVVEATPPVAVGDEYTMNANAVLAIDAPGVLANDSTEGELELVAELLEGPSSGDLTLAADGSLVYTPATDFVGTVTFTYQVRSGDSVSAPATVTINVLGLSNNFVPVATGDAYTTTVDTPLVQAAPGVLANDTDAEGDPITALLVAPPSSGELTFNPDGSFTYTPAAGFVGQDSFTYAAVDATGESTPVTVTIDVVTSENSRPVASNDEYHLDADSTLTTTPENGVMSNDSDLDGDALTAAIFQQPLNGQVTFAADGSFVYTPNAGFSGTDGFTYWINDGELESMLAAVTLQVAAAPTEELPTPGGTDETPTEEDDCTPAPIDTIVDDDSEEESDDDDASCRPVRCEIDLAAVENIFGRGNRFGWRRWFS